MGWILFILFAIVGYTVWEQVFKKDNFGSLKELNGENPKAFFSTFYSGGFRDVSPKRNHHVDLYFFEDTVRFIFNNTKDLTTHRDIKREDIKRVSFMNQNTVKEYISVGRLIVFGWVGLIAKKQEEKNIEYIVIEVNYEGERINILLNDGIFIESNFEIIDSYIKETKSRVNS